MENIDKIGLTLGYLGLLFFTLLFMNSFDKLRETYDSKSSQVIMSEEDSNIVQGPVTLIKPLEKNLNEMLNE